MVRHRFASEAENEPFTPGIRVSRLTVAMREMGPLGGRAHGDQFENPLAIGMAERDLVRLATAKCAYGGVAARSHSRGRPDPGATR